MSGEEDVVRPKETGSSSGDPCPGDYYREDDATTAALVNIIEEERLKEALKAAEARRSAIEKRLREMGYEVSTCISFIK